MSYPEPRYTGTGGEPSATYRPADSAPDLVYASGNTVHYLATGAGTNGQFGMYLWSMGPQPSGPDPHFHRSISESFYTLSGTVRIYDGRRWIDTGPGDFVHVPEGGIHAFRNESGSRRRCCCTSRPGHRGRVISRGCLIWPVLATRNGPRFSWSTTRSGCNALAGIWRVLAGR